VIFYVVMLCNYVTYTSLHIFYAIYIAGKNFFCFLKKFTNIQTNVTKKIARGQMHFTQVFTVKYYASIYIRLI